MIWIWYLISLLKNYLLFEEIICFWNSCWICKSALWFSHLCTVASVSSVWVSLNVNCLSCPQSTIRLCCRFVVQLVAQHRGGSRNLRKRGATFPLPSPPLPFPSSSLPSFPLSLPLTFPCLLSFPFPGGPPPKPARGSGEHCKLPQRGPGQSPGRKSNFEIFGAQERHLVARI